MLYFHEMKAAELQTRLDCLLVSIEKHKSEIWSSETKDTGDNDFEYGPGATVQSIVEKKNTIGTTKPKGVIYYHRNNCPKLQKFMYKTYFPFLKNVIYIANNSDWIVKKIDKKYLNLGI